MAIVETPLSRVRVRDVMHTGILTTDVRTPLRVVAGLMARQGVHAIAVVDPEVPRWPYAFVTTTDVTKAVADDADLSAGQAAHHDILCIPEDYPLTGAARRLIGHGDGHAVVVDRATAHAVGILSTLDIAAAYGG